MSLHTEDEFLYHKDGDFRFLRNVCTISTRLHGVNSRRQYSSWKGVDREESGLFKLAEWRGLCILAKIELSLYIIEYIPIFTKHFCFVKYKYVKLQNVELMFVKETKFYF